LDNTRLTDAGLVNLKGMTKLTFLHLGSTEVTNEGMPELEPLVGLKDLKLTRTNVDKEGADALQKKLPDTNIQLVYEGT